MVSVLQIYFQRLVKMLWVVRKYSIAGWEVPGYCSFPEVRFGLVIPELLCHAFFAIVVRFTLVSRRRRDLKC